MQKRVLWSALFACITILFFFHVQIYANEEEMIPPTEAEQEEIVMEEPVAEVPQEETIPPDTTTPEEAQEVPEEPMLKTAETNQGHVTAIVEGEPDSEASSAGPAVARVSDGQPFHLRFDIPNLQYRNAYYYVGINLYAHVPARTFTGGLVGRTDSSGHFSDTIEVQVDRGLHGLTSMALQVYYLDNQFNFIHERDINTDYSDSSFDMFIVNTGLSDSHHTSRLLVNDENVNDQRIQAITSTQAAQGVDLRHHISAYVRQADTEYQTVTRFYQINPDGSRQQIGNDIITTQRSGADRMLTATIDMGRYDSLLPGTQFGVETDILGESENYRLSYSSYQHNWLFILDHHNDPKEEDTLVNVRIDKKDEKGNPVIGALLEIIRGTDPNGTDVVATWTSDGTIYEIKLPVGDYVLVERSAPKGWLIAKPIQFSLVDSQANVHGYNYVSYTKYARDESDILYYQFILTKDLETTEDIAYCINYRKPSPDVVDFDSVEYMFYKESELTAEIAQDHFYNKDMTGQEIIDALRRVIYNGHPYNASGIMEKYNLSTGAFVTITQNAIHHFTDNVEFTESNFKSIDYYNAYMELIQSTLDPPENWLLTLYIPSHDGHQTLISASFREAGLSLDMVMTDPIDSRKDKPDEKPDKKKESEKKDEKKEEEKKTVTKADGVQTGLSTQMWMYVGLFAISGFGLLKRQA